MPHNPYERFSSQATPLRDELAIDRTTLANERTFLAYVRTALTLVIAGLSFVHFISSGPMRWVGAGFAVAGLMAGGYGLHRYQRMKRQISAARHKAGDSSSTLPHD